jgi:hypothetical protein
MNWHVACDGLFGNANLEDYNEGDHEDYLQARAAADSGDSVQGLGDDQEGGEGAAR